MNGKDKAGNHNGWTNYETWAVNLWLANEEGSYRYWREEARLWSKREYSVDELAYQLQEEIQGGAPNLGASLYSDLLNSALTKVDWEEISKSWLDDVADEWQSEGDSCDGLPETDSDDQQEPTASAQVSCADGDGESPTGSFIYVYSRAQAIEDGVLVDVSETSREAGFHFPVALTRAVHEKFVVVPKGIEGQDEQGRLWDILFMCSLAIRGVKGSEVCFSLHVRNSNCGGTPPLVTLKAHCGPGDRGEPVMTILLPDED